MISTTTLQNLMSIMAAMVSSSGRRSVGPKHTPKFDMVIKFLLDFAATLFKKQKSTSGLSLRSQRQVNSVLLFQVTHQNVKHHVVVLGQPVDQSVHVGGAVRPRFLL